MSHTKLTKVERFKIEAYLNTSNYNYTDIAYELGKSRDCISKEVRRNSYPSGVYQAAHADKLSQQRYLQGRRVTKKLTKYPKLHKRVVLLLTKTWSPEQICQRGLQKSSMKVCPETIYQYIYTEQKELTKYLRKKKNKYRRKHGTKKRCQDRENTKKQRIESRPAVVKERKRLGDFEGDTVEGMKGSGSLLTLVDRKSGYAKARKVENEEKTTITEAIITALKHLPQKKRRTLTLDNGSGFWDFELFDRALNTQTYFANPYHAWERGCNENFNGLLREFFPKKTSFATVTQKDVDRVVKLLNHRPRKRLGYLTPHEVFVLGKRPKKRLS